MFIQKPKGTYDILPDIAVKRQRIYKIIRDKLEIYNYQEILTPVFEKTELFKRSIGNETDIVSKEMYTFNNDEFSLRPELTAPVVRAYLENSLYNESPVKKLYYICNLFRRERPQLGRYREFWQYGAEIIGTDEPKADAELLILAEEIIKACGINNYRLRLNTIGKPEERTAYINELKKYLSSHLEKLSKDSRIRFEKNPLRILDSKDENDIGILKNAPILFELLGIESKQKFENLTSILKALNVDFEIDYKLVRGLDYYTDMTFEFTASELGAQNTLIGGGRYNLLVKQLGGRDTPAAGFAGGVERLMLTSPIDEEKRSIDLYIAVQGNENTTAALNFIFRSRAAGIITETDFLSRSLKAQLKEANKLNAKYVIVLGESEMKTSKAKLKEMKTGNEIELTLDDNFENNLIKSVKNEN